MTKRKIRKIYGVQSPRIVSFIARLVRQDLYRVVDDDGYSVGFLASDETGEMHAFGATVEKARERLAAKLMRNRINAALVLDVQPKGRKS